MTTLIDWSHITDAEQLDVCLLEVVSIATTQLQELVQSVPQHLRDTLQFKVLERVILFRETGNQSAMDHTYASFLEIERAMATASAAARFLYHGYVAQCLPRQFKDDVRERHLEEARTALDEISMMYRSAALINFVNSPVE